MSDLIAPVKDGKLQDVETSENKKKKEKNIAGGELGKEEFLQLLVTQMQYQDPLEPNKDTDYISQLAQFSSLEQMQNLNTTMSNSAALGYVGQTVKVTHEDSSGNVNEVRGEVEYVKVQNGTAYVSIDGRLYKADEVTEVLDAVYIAKQKAPTVEETVLSYSHTDPASQKIMLDLGKDDGAATAVAVAINDKVIDSAYLDYDTENKILSIHKDAFAYLDAGKYELTLAFNDRLNTTVNDKVTLTVSGIKPEKQPEPPTKEPEESEVTDKEEETKKEDAS